jgi:hypothetical protein
VAGRTERDRIGTRRAERTRLCRRFFDRDPASFGGDGTEDAEDDDASDEDASRGDGTSTPGGTSAPSETSTPDGTEWASGRDEAASGAARSTPDGHDGGSIPPTPDGPPRAGDRESETDDRAADAGVAADATERPEWLGRVAVIGLALSLALGGVVAGTGPDVGVGSAGSVFGGNETETDPAPTDEYPRGVDSTGVRDASALADAHEAALANRSYRLEITYREFVDGELRGVAHERAVVAERGRYRSRVRRLGALRHDSRVIASGSAYSNGTTAYVRTSDGVRERAEVRSALGSTTTDSLGCVGRTERLVRWYLSVEESRIVEVTEADGTAHLRLVFEGDPWPDARNVTGSARVERSGLVRELTREYTPGSERNVRVEVTVRIDPGPVTVTRPAWMASTTNASDDRDASTTGEPSVDRLAGGRP